MPLNEQQILEIKRRAISQGVPEEQVELGMAQLMEKYNQVPATDTSSVSTPQAPVQNNPTQNTTSNPAQSSSSASANPEQEASIVGQFFKSLYDSGANYVGFVGEAVAQGVRAGADSNISAFGDESSDVDVQIKNLGIESRDLITQAKNTTDQAKKAQLLQRSRNIDAQIEQLGNQAREIGASTETFAIDSEKIEDRSSIATTGAKVTAGAASLAVPGAKTVKGAVALGAATGALAGVSNDDATFASVTSDAVVGGVTGGAFGVAGKGVSWMFSKRTPKKVQDGILKRVGQQLREDATQIRQKPSVYGAKQEKAIQETLDSLDINGGPQEKYEQLLPKMDQLEQLINKTIADNPKTISMKGVVRSFRKSLDGEVRTKSLTSKAAQNEIRGYLTDLLKLSDPDFARGKSLIAGSTNVSDDMPLEKLFKLKKLINEDYGKISSKVFLGTPLNDREKVILHGRNAIDEAITKSLPAVKDMTIMQSHLFDAARSLSSARGTTPTFRVFGVTIPKQKVIQDWIGRGLISLDDKSQSLVKKWVDPKTNRLKEGVDSIDSADKKLLFNAVQKIAIVSGAKDVSDTPQDEQAQIEQNNQSGGSQDNNQQDVQNGVPSGVPTTDSVPQPDPDHPFQGRSKEEILRLAMSEGKDLGQLKEIAEVYDMLVPEDEAVDDGIDALLDRKAKLEKAGRDTSLVDDKLTSAGFKDVGRTTKIAATTENRIQLANSGLRGLTEVEDILGDDPAVVLKNFLPGQPGARQYASAAYRAVEGLLRARSGAAVPPHEVISYQEANLPRALDSRGAAKAKLKAFRLDLEEVAGSTGTVDFEVAQQANQQQ